MWVPAAPALPNHHAPPAATPPAALTAESVPRGTPPASLLNCAAGAKAIPRSAAPDPALDPIGWSRRSPPGRGMTPDSLQAVSRREVGAPNRSQPTLASD